MRKNVLKNLLLLQSSALLLILTLLPEFDLISMMTGIDLNFPVLICKLIGTGGVGIGLFTLSKQKQAANENLPIPLFALYGGGALLALLSLIPSFPGWLSYVGLAMLAIALFIGKGSQISQWKQLASGGAYLILLAVIMHVFTFINNTTATTTAALVGLIMYFIGLGKLQIGMDTAGSAGVGKLKIAIIIGIVSVVFDYIPLMGWLSTILAVAAFIFEFLGYGLLKSSATIGGEGKEGANMLRNSMVVLMVSALVSFLSDTVAGILAIVALLMVFNGWSKILFGLEEEKQSREQYDV